MKYAFIIFLSFFVGTKINNNDILSKIMADQFEDVIPADPAPARESQNLKHDERDA